MVLAAVTPPAVHQGAFPFTLCHEWCCGSTQTGLYFACVAGMMKAPELLCLGSCSAAYLLLILPVPSCSHAQHDREEHDCHGMSFS